MSVDTAGYIPKQCATANYNEQCPVECAAGYTGTPRGPVCSATGAWSSPSGCSVPGADDDDKSSGNTVAGIDIDMDTGTAVGIGVGVLALGVVGAAVFLVAKRRRAAVPAARPDGTELEQV